jgi:hypothetical protein
MAEDKIDGTMNDDGLACEIDALINVQPSPEFLARVRTRLESEPLRARVLPSRWVLLSAAALSLVVLMTWWNDAPFTPDSTSGSRIADILLDQLDLPPVSREPISGFTVDAVRQGESEVLVSPREAAGLRLLLRAVQEGRIDSDVLPPVIADATPIAIEPIVIEPLVAAVDLDAGGAQ